MLTGSEIENQRNEDKVVETGNWTLEQKRDSVAF
jgi:hypothetical protein